MMIVCLLLCLFLILSFLVYASYSIQSGIYLRSFCKKRTTEKVVALTFDDGPDPIQTPKVNLNFNALPPICYNFVT